MSTALQVDDTAANESGRQSYFPATFRCSPSLQIPAPVPPSAEPRGEANSASATSEIQFYLPRHDWVIAGLMHSAFQFQTSQPQTSVTMAEPNDGGDPQAMLSLRSPGPESSAADPASVTSYLSKLLSVMLDAGPNELQILLDGTSDTMNTLNRFASDPQVQAIYVLKERASASSHDGIRRDSVALDDGSTPCTYSIFLEASYPPDVITALAIIKRFPIIDANKPLSSQLQVINIPGIGDGANAFEALRAHVHHGLTPYFDAYVAAKTFNYNNGINSSNTVGAVGGIPGRDFDKEAKSGIPLTKKKLADLDLSLLHLQQNIDIPEISLNIHPIIQNAVAQCRDLKQRISIDAVEQVADEATILRKLENDVKGWIREIQKVTKLSRDPDSGSAIQEINFWMNLERALAQIEDQLKSDEVVLTLDYLKAAKRFHLTVSFLSDTGLKEAIDLVQKYNQLMKDFPLNELLAASDLKRVQESLLMIFGHLNKKLRISPYPIRRALPLVEAISRDLYDSLYRVLNLHRLMFIDYEDFEKETRGCDEVFRTWDEQFKEFGNVAREVSRKRSEKFLPIKINAAHAKLQERIVYIRGFRKSHEQLHTTILRVMRPGGTKQAGSYHANAVTKDVDFVNIEVLEDVKLAYEAVKNVDVLDVSSDGTENWMVVEHVYNERVARVENQIIARLRDRLATAKTAHEMFRVFSKFNALFIRPKIRGAIQEYQNQLIESVKEDLQALQDKFKLSYRNSEAAHVSSIRDLPPVGGAIAWARQIERQLGLYMRRVEDVLGKGWELYAEGQKLAAIGSAFRKKLETRPVYDAWLAEITRREVSVSGLIFDVSKSRTAGGSSLALSVNFDPQVITLFKEPKMLNEIKQMDSIVAPLVMGYHRDVHQLIASRGIQLKWDYFANSYDPRLGGLEAAGYSTNTKSENRHVTFVRDFVNVVTILQDKTFSALAICEEINGLLNELKDCSYVQVELTSILVHIQKAVDRLNLENCANLDTWTTMLNQRIEGVLLNRLQVAIKAWNAAIDPTESNSEDFAQSLSVPQNGEMITEQRRPRIHMSVHEMKLRSQCMYLDPPVEKARESLYRQFHDWLAIVCGLKRIQSSRYELDVTAAQTNQNTTYSSLLANVTSNLLPKAYAILENTIDDASKYLNVWIQYQALWDLDEQMLYNRLGDDLRQWQQLVLEIKKARSTFDTSETSKNFGCISIDYEQVQIKVNAKYDQWQRDVINKFGARLGAAMREFHAAVSKSRHDLEAQSADAPSTSDAVSFITLLQSLKRNLGGWSEEVEIFRMGQNTLERQRYIFPTDWLYVDNIEGEWSALNEIYTKKNAAAQNQLVSLQMKIIGEDKIVQGKIKDAATEWDKCKPVQGDVKHDRATDTLNVFEGRVTRLKEEYDQVCRAKSALDLEISLDEKLGVILEELRDLKSVWSALSRVWQSLYEIKDTPFSMAAPRKIRQQLDALLNSAKDMPSRLRQYAAYEYMQESIKSFVKIIPLFTDLKSVAVRERHWRVLLKSLKREGTLSLLDMTVGQVWDLDLRKNEAVVRDVVAVAQGEMALEEFLKAVKETWTSYALDLVNYQNKCRLIRGWDELLTKCSEHLSSLMAMKHSPFYKVFEEEAFVWHDKLNRIHVLFDVWIDVQRQWVYLEGIFSGSADIKHLLPTETSRFQNINAEFMALMKKVYKSPYVLDVLNIQNIQKSLERLAELLAKIQKALGEYLEKERQSFPRFYFVGDEDLLEIIGNSKDVMRIQKHFKKMFAGVSSLVLDDNASEILGLASREGEIMTFFTPVSIKDNPKINDWLKLLENEMRISLGTWLKEAAMSLSSFFNRSSFKAELFLDWIHAHPAQIVTLGIQVHWSQSVERALQQAESSRMSSKEVLASSAELVEKSLTILADTVLTDLLAVRRKKCEHLITELVHQRDVIRHLVRHEVTSPKSFEWLYQMRFYYNPSIQDSLRRLTVHMANASFVYGYEYLGVVDRLVQTPLTDRCYLTLTQALQSRLGGSPFGPAGTGKTESVKALGVQLGRFVLVFNCDETFDFQAMGRIFVGLCRVGAWGCFDEFNRLEERILSAVSQQIQTIQLALKEESEIDLVGKQLKVHPSTGIFITMNPGYAGRSNLPDNLKKLFRSIAMAKPDRELISQVMLFSQGFRNAELVASKIVPFFNLCQEQLSSQSHYDFGLRALKSVLVSAGNVKRDRLVALRKLKADAGDDELLQTRAESEEASISKSRAEQEILIQSIQDTVVPKLVAEDVSLMQSLASDVFPGIEYKPLDVGDLMVEIQNICDKEQYVAHAKWVEKIVQLYQIQRIHHGVMMVGPTGSGKSSAWRVLLKALQNMERVDSESYIIDAKAITKYALYGFMDPTTREWTDGLFTHILRRIVDNVRGEVTKRHWIVFDGDVDPEWVENLNSVLDDNKLLTLPNGERLALPPNVRIMFEVETLRYATLATVSRCGMVWFSDDVVSASMMCHHYLEVLKAVPLDKENDEGYTNHGDDSPGSVLVSQQTLSEILARAMSDDGLVIKALEFSSTLGHIMEFTRVRALTSLFSLINKTARNITEYNANHPDFPMGLDHLESYVMKRLFLAIIWSFVGDARIEDRTRLADFLVSVASIDLPQSLTSIIDFDVNVNTGQWVAWQTKVPNIEIEPQGVATADVVIPTLDTLRHEDILYSWLSEHKPLILCGPPGSGKTMTLFAALRKLPEVEVVGLNFSSATTPELILKTFEQHCDFKRTPRGLTLSPRAIGRWLVVFCDEINLPSRDKYGTQRVISFMRQLVEHGGYWRAADKSWVVLDRIQFVGACNPPTDPGRVPMTHRFLRHAPIVMVDYPGEKSLLQIYNTFSRAMLKVVPSVKGYAETLTGAMVELYLSSQKQFTPDQQAHYVYSPRELTRWVRGIYEAVKPLETISLEGLVRIWAHEALRLFQDRLVTEAERRWTDDIIDSVASKHFVSLDIKAVLKRPILFSDWLSKHYVSVDRDVLRDFVRARLKVFYEEELDVPLVLFNDVLDHVLRIDRVFKQMQGHMLLIGVSGSGKTTLSRFVAWINGLSVFQIQVHNKYSAADFDEDLRTVLRRAGTRGEKVCFIMDESNVLESGFLERMNTLLANAEIPGLFEGDEYTALMNQCKEGAQRDGVIIDSTEELYKWFTHQVMKNLHVVFTMNPPEAGLGSRAATSPALFNRCVLDWFGDWSDQAFYQVAKEFTESLDFTDNTYTAPMDFPLAYDDLPMPPDYRNAIVNAFVFVHQSLYDVNAKLGRREGRHNYATPRHYLDFISHYVKVFGEKREDLEDRQRHLNVGLDKLKDTVVKVEELRKSLASKKRELEAKTVEANEKLKKMVSDQQEAEQKRAASLHIQNAIAKQNEEIEKRRSVVVAQLAEAEPAVLEAQQSVSNIKKQHLTEVRSMANPPDAVKMAMESVCILLGNRLSSWKDVQIIIRRDDFIASMVNYETNQLTTSVRHEVKTRFLDNPNYNFEIVNRASKACGPLVQWVIAQVLYSEILQEVGPLRTEVADLEESANETRLKAVAIDEMIKELEASIGRYKDEYAVLIGETQALKAEMERVKSKVDRSVTLLSNLASEKERWQSTSMSFDVQMGTIVGDVLLASAFLTYAGFFDQSYRAILLSKWTTHLEKSGIRSKVDLAISEYLSTAEERLMWQKNSLPSDNLCTENAIMMKRFNRYPLIIDPSGQATTFLLNDYRDRKMAVASFLDDAFVKVLESSLRFGNPLLLQDVESLDPILNTILNHEIKRTGGRILIRIGNQDIDFSPSFTLFLSTRDSSTNFSPDICSRVTFVNFTVTAGSLQSQCLHEVLKSERPDIDKKRTDLIKLQGEFQLRLRHLEKALLQALSESKGNILDDDNVMVTLETLKQEAGEVAAKMDETDAVMKTVEDVTHTYTPLAQACASIFFVMERLSALNHFYQFSLEFFLEIFSHVIHKNPRLASMADSSQRLSVITEDLYTVVYTRVCRSLLHVDHATFVMLLAQIRLKSHPDTINEGEYEVFVGGHEGTSRMNHALQSQIAKVVGDEATKRMNGLVTLPIFAKLTEHILAHESLWKSFMSGNTVSVPPCWIGADSEKSIVNAFRKLLVVGCFRPDKIFAATDNFIEVVFSKAFTDTTELSLKSIVMDEVKASTPVAFCSVAGFDASFRVEAFAKDVSGRIKSVAMGSAEGVALADAAIATAVRTGTWVLIKNVHLATAWLTQLEKKLYNLKAHPNFRLFLTMEINPKVPANIIRVSRCLMFEPAPGVKANLLDTLTALPHDSISKGPAERPRLYFLLAWLHAVIQERLRYVPLGWTKVYEFNDSDFDCALTMIDNWLEATAGGRSNIPPAKIPWGAITTLLKQTVYGGKVDSDVDQNVLDSFIDGFFSPASYESSFHLAAGEGLVIPEGTRMNQFINWVQSLPSQQSPAWLGLPRNAETVLMAMQGLTMVSNIRKMKVLADDEYDAKNLDISDIRGRDSTAFQIPSWMRSLHQTAQEWLKLLPETIPAMSRPTTPTVKAPLRRFFERENKLGHDLLKNVRMDLFNLEKVCTGQMKQTNHLRELMSSIIRGVVPNHWKVYKSAHKMTLNQWIVEFELRLEQISRVAKQSNLNEFEVWLGGLFMPEAFITASRQAVAQHRKWSLEELELQVHVEDSAHRGGFTVSGLRLEGAEFKDGLIHLSSAVSSPLPFTSILWTRRQVATSQPISQPLVTIPVYLNRDRDQELFKASFACPSEIESRLLLQHAVAIVTTA
ncbi:hypothetical protein SeMB42_g00788 [Synchytrium endobioticum]|uniref:Dynein heavy chain, cytoplasmic n=1 Tax=Synchytrium endobioticum TaxID=286115 RepID=A0A507DP33_9FUNG|nr:hypothetical protein SeMB42_g00788 [Synchytrium endobioticum]